MTQRISDKKSSQSFLARLVPDLIHSMVQYEINRLYDPVMQKIEDNKPLNAKEVIFAEFLGFHQLVPDGSETIDVNQIRGFDNFPNIDEKSFKLL